MTKAIKSKMSVNKINIQSENEEYSIDKLLETQRELIFYMNVVIDLQRRLAARGLDPSINHLRVVKDSRIKRK